MQRNFRVLIWGCKKCSEGNFVTSAKVSWENHFKVISNHYLNQMFDQGRSVRRSITAVTFESLAGKNVSFNSISC